MMLIELLGISEILLVNFSNKDYLKEVLKKN
jgi:hypothetical protein